MNKQDTAMYLVNLNTLLAAQSASVHNPSTVLADEYNKHWDLLKETITKENEDEARKSKLQHDGGDKALNRVVRSEPEGGRPDRLGAEPSDPPSA